MIKLIFFLLIIFNIIGCSQTINVKKDINLDKLVDLHNKFRSKWNYKELKKDDNLKKYANNHANFMVKSKKLKHSNLKNIINMGFTEAGENIAWNQQTEDEVMNSWMWSPGHRSNILNKEYDSIGCGVAYDEDNIYWCVVFGKKFTPN